MPTVTEVMLHTLRGRLMTTFFTRFVVVINIIMRFIYNNNINVSNIVI